MRFLDGGEGILVFARPSGREAGVHAVRNAWAGPGVDLFARCNINEP